ncbi:MAG: SH3 domain-containing protein [Anaerolineales bacterium]|nr:SH3 domain-containing protein [Anaerolineales bacterium]
MKRFWIYSPIFIVLVALAACGMLFASFPTAALAQQPTETPTPQGIYITVLSDEPFANIRMGPSSSIYPKVGILYPGDTALALGRSPGGDWIKIEYPGAPNNAGWVYSPLVRLSSGALRIAEPPPTPIPPATATIDPTFAAQFTIVPTNVRLPTFTPPPPLVVTSYTQAPASLPNDSVPLAVIIIALAILGAIGFLLSLFLRR